MYGKLTFDLLWKITIWNRRYIPLSPLFSRGGCVLKILKFKVFNQPVFRHQKFFGKKKKLILSGFCGAETCSFPLLDPQDSWWKSRLFRTKAGRKVGPHRVLRYHPRSGKVRKNPEDVLAESSPCQNDDTTLMAFPEGENTSWGW